MIIVLIICGILYLIMIYGVLYLYYTYNKDYNDLEYRILQNEKRINEKTSTILDYIDTLHIKEMEIIERCYQEIEKIKEGDNKEMACKGKRKK